MNKLLPTSLLLLATFSTWASESTINGVEVVPPEDTKITSKSDTCQDYVCVLETSDISYVATNDFKDIWITNESDVELLCDIINEFGVANEVNAKIMKGSTLTEVNCS